MKFCYVDESGTGSEPFAVMVGIIADAQRMHVTKDDWSQLLAILTRLVGRPVGEIHTNDFYPGNGPWRGLDGDSRTKIIAAIFKWLDDRKHSIVYSAVDKAKFQSQFAGEAHSTEIGTLWRFMALHICLSLQKHYQSQKKNKGNTVLVFDRKDTDAFDFIEIIRNPPDWTDTYYAKKPKQERLDQIIDVPYFGDSKHVGLIQVADFVSFFLRRHIEITQNAVAPKYEKEEELISSWAESAFARAIPKSAIYPAKGRCDCAELFYKYAASSVL